MLQGEGWARYCDACRAVASAVFCRDDALFLCSSCDTQAHASGSAPSRHERVWVCEGCKQAPAVFACKADAAALCATCDMDVHSNPLASRHTRVPVLPITGDPAGRERCGVPTNPFLSCYAEPAKEEEAPKGPPDPPSAWPFVFDSQGNYDNPRNYVDFFFTGNDVNEGYRDAKDYKPPAVEDAARDGGDFVHKYETEKPSESYSRNFPEELVGKPEERRSYEVGFGILGMPKEEIPKPFTLSYSISPSSVEERVVPEDSVDNNISKSKGSDCSKGSLDVLHHEAEQTAAQSDRHARVLRYWEKKKRRNFVKTIRYASRKAYAEVRPRVKGRFAKRTDPSPADRMMKTTISTELTYDYSTYGHHGVVPSF